MTKVKKAENHFCSESHGYISFFLDTPEKSDINRVLVRKCTRGEICGILMQICRPIEPEKRDQKRRKWYV
jgi:hypothetical protein